MNLQNCAFIDFLNKLFGIRDQCIYLLVCAMTKSVFSHADIMYVV